MRLLTSLPDTVSEYNTIHSLQLVYAVDSEKLQYTDAAMLSLFNFVLESSSSHKAIMRYITELKDRIATLYVEEAVSWLIPILGIERFKDKIHAILSHCNKETNAIVVDDGVLEHLFRHQFNYIQPTMVPASGCLVRAEVDNFSRPHWRQILENTSDCVVDIRPFEQNTLMRQKLKEVVS